MKIITNLWLYSLVIMATFIIFTLSCSDEDNKPNNEIPDIVRDIDDNEYPVVVIGDQIWMGENLRTTHYNNGTEIPNNLSDSEWEETVKGSFAVYPHEDIDGINTEEEMTNAYGKLYNWYAVKDERGLCPDGWRVPTDDEWTKLTDHLINEYDLHNDDQIDEIDGVGNALKSCRQVNSPMGGDCNTNEHPRWASHRTHYGTDDFDFSALPAGLRNHDGTSLYLSHYAIWWTNTQYDKIYSYSRFINSSFGNIDRDYNNKNTGFSVRCIMDLQD